MPKQHLKGRYLFFLMVLFFFSQFFFYSSNSPAADRVIYLTPGSDAYANGTAWENAAKTLYWDTETTGTKTVSIGNGEYRFIGGNDAMHCPGIRHVATDTTRHFSNDNSNDDATTGVMIYGGICPRENTYFENLIFRYHSSTSLGDLVD